MPPMGCLLISGEHFPETSICAVLGRRGQIGLQNKLLQKAICLSLSLQSSLLKKNIFRVILIKKRSSVGCEYPFIWKECLEGSKMGLVELIQIRIPNQITGELCIILQYCKFYKGKEGRPESKQLRKRNMQATSHQN